MDILPSHRLHSLGSYAFAEVDKLVAELKKQGVTPIDFGVGDPIEPTPKFIRQSLQEATEKHATSGYPSYIGSQEFRQAASQWMQRRFNVNLNPDREISSSIGAKEAVFHFPEAIINPGDMVIIPSPGYPPMRTGTIFAEGAPYFVPLLAKNNFLVDFKSIPKEVCKKAKIIWINYPNSPTGVTAPRAYYEELIEWAHENNIIIAADEGCYIDIYFEKKPLSILEVAKEGIITFYSLSKRSNMTGYRVGFVAGDEKLVSLFKQLKTHIDSGTPNFIQEAAITALADEEHVEKSRKQYQEKRDIMLTALASIGLATRKNEATFYIWQKVPEGMDSISFAKLLLQPEVGIVTTPGSWISQTCADGTNPGENYARFALVPSIQNCEEAAKRIRKIKL